MLCYPCKALQHPLQEVTSMNQSERRRFLIEALLDESPQYQNTAIPADADGQKSLLRGLMNIRDAKPCSNEFLRVQDEYLREEIRAHGITDADSLTSAQPGIYLWQGDITTLRCDAIVNAANSGMTGCYVPNHRCIDNAIHTFAGVQLRQRCAEIMEQQGEPEPVGEAKITPAYNLPCRYVIHTVGPFVPGRVTPLERAQLRRCYDACLRLAAENKLESIAFCCISTGEFHFPNEAAATIAIEAVLSLLQTPTSIKKVIFNVFKDSDKAIYERLLSEFNPSAPSPCGL